MLSRIRSLFSGPKKVQSPEKELRFTRGNQALLFAAIGSFFFCLCFGLAVMGSSFWTPEIGSMLGTFLYVLIPLPFAIVFFWLAARMIRHAYIILTPLGIEIFPFFRPEKNMQIVYWSEVENACLTDDDSTLVISVTGGSKIFVTLKPIRKSARTLLKRAIDGTIDKRKESQSSDA